MLYPKGKNWQRPTPHGDCPNSYGTTKKGAEGPGKGRLLYLRGVILSAFRLTYLFLLSILAPSAALALEVPAHHGYVNDYAGMISPEAEARITQTLQEFDRTDSTQVAILTIDSLEGEDIAGFGIRVAEKWGMGQKGRDNGVLLLVSRGDRKSRIEVGRGLEGVLTDLAAGRIVDRIIRPEFKAGRFDEGFEQATAAIIAATRGEFKADKKVTARSVKSAAEGVLHYLIFFAIIVGAAGQMHRGLGIAAGALLLPLFAWMGLGALPMLALLLLFPLGGAAGLLLALLFHESGRGGFGGGFFPGGFGGGGGSSGGGFEGFGGGGFGGGGASGDW